MKSGDLLNSQSNENNREQNDNQATEEKQTAEKSEKSSETKSDYIKKENCFVSKDAKGIRSHTLAQRKKRKLGIIIA